MILTPLRQLARLAVPASAALLASRASAQIVYTNLSATTVSGSSSSTLDLDMGDGIGGTGGLAVNSSVAGHDFLFSYGQSNTAKPQVQGYNTNAIYSTPTFFYAGNLASGATIDGSLTFNNLAKINLAGNNNGSWAAGTTGYLSVRFQGSDSSTHYGWVGLTFGADQTLAINGFAYEQTAGAAIAAGATSAIPEPSSYALGAAILAGSAALYRRRQQKKDAAAQAAA